MDLKPPFWPEDSPALLELLGPEEFERVVCPIDLARVQYGQWARRNEEIAEKVVERLARGSGWSDDDTEYVLGVFS
jgi:hypothetical protein